MFNIFSHQKIQIKAVLTIHLTLVRMVTKKTANGAEDAGKEEYSYAGRSAIWCSHYGNGYGGSTQQRAELPYDPAILLLGIYPKESGCHGDTCCMIIIAQMNYDICKKVDGTREISQTWKQYFLSCGI